MRRTWIAFGVITLAFACTEKKFGKALAPYHMVPHAEAGPGPDEIAKKAHMAKIASLNERAIGPFLARSEKGALAAYISGAATGGLRPVVALALDAHGVPVSQARVVAQAAADTSTLVVRHVTSVQAEGGWLLAWTSLTDRGESLSLVGLTDAGVARASAIELARTPDHIVWVEVVSTPRGAVCVWAEEPPAGGANVLAQALDASGKPRGVPSRVVRGATSWQALSSGDGVALAIASATGLVLMKLDAEGRVVGEPAPIAKTFGEDMDVVHAGKDLAFVWTDRTHVDPQIMIAGVDAQAKLVAPHVALPDAGSSSLVALASGEKNALILWESSRKRERTNRRVNAATLADANATLVTHTQLDLAAGAIEARERGDGFALMAFARPCALAKADDCAAAAPMFVRLDASLAVVQTEALVMGPPVSLGWSLECAKDGCIALAAGPDAPTTVYALDLADRASAHAAPVAPALPEDAPRLVSSSTIVSGVQVGDLATARVGDTTLIASIVSTGADEKTHEERNTLRITPIANNKPLATVTLSAKALGTGGVAMTSSASAKEAVVVYVAKEGAGGRVHITRIDDHGVKRGESTLPGGGKGDAGDVSIVAVDNGYVVAWVDTRDGNGEVYTAKIGNDLSATAPLRITNAPGDATDTALTTAGANVILAWADPRESPHDGFSDIYAVALSTRDGRPLAKEGRVLSTAAHSRSPALASTSLGAALAWIEEAPAGAASEEAKGAMFALLDDHAKPIRDPSRLRFHDPGIVTAIALDSAPGTRLLHAVTARTWQDELWIDAARLPLDAGGALESYPLVALDGPSSLDVALTLRGDEVIFSDDGPDAADARARRGLMIWKK